jgi:hypothetical protein
VFPVRYELKCYRLLIGGRESQGAWRQDELIGGKLPVVSNSDSVFVFKFGFIFCDS